MPAEVGALLIVLVPDVRRAALWHAVNVWAFPRQPCEGA